MGRQSDHIAYSEMIKSAEVIVAESVDLSKGCHDTFPFLSVRSSHILKESCALLVFCWQTTGSVQNHKFVCLCRASGQLVSTCMQAVKYEQTKAPRL